MPELPEVEVVRRGMARWLTGSVVQHVRVWHPRAVRRHGAGAADFEARLEGRTITDVVRRGKYAWLELDTHDAMVVHLGMSGQMLLSADRPDDALSEQCAEPAGSDWTVQPAGPHDRAVLVVTGGRGGGGARSVVARFVDQRTFGSLQLVPLVSTEDGLPAGVGGRHGEASASLLPQTITHIGRDVLDPFVDVDAVVRVMNRRSSDIKRTLLDQGLISGIGNIYADEALWQAQMHYATPACDLPPARVREVVAAAAEVMRRALEVGGTSFDRLYVNVDGRQGYFARSLAAYGKAGEPCPRCGTAITRQAFMNRSSYLCPSCQPDIH